MIVQALWILSLGLLVHGSGDKEDFDICREPLQEQICRAAIPSWYHDTKTNSCKEFIYGGCPGVNNKFATKETCMRRCQPEVCLLPHEVGPCRASIPTWFYDSDARLCREFSYGGCAGNENRFTSQHSCEQACAGINLPCELSENFETVGSKNVHSAYRDREWFLEGCNRQCRSRCLDDQPWGACMAYSTRKRWHGCYCYLYDRTLGEAEFDQRTSGTTKNRLCNIEE